MCEKIVNHNDMRHFYQSTNRTVRLSSLVVNTLYNEDQMSALRQEGFTIRSSVSMETPVSEYKSITGSIINNGDNVAFKLVLSGWAPATIISKT